MSTNWSNYRGKRLDFSFFKGGGKTEYLVAGVLGIVIIGAAYMAIRQFVGGDSVSVSDKITFKCDKCGNVFTKKISELPQAHNPAEQMNSMLLDCPKCGQKKSCWQAMECPNCHEIFIGDSTRAMYKRMTMGRGPDNVPDICPKCKTNLNTWWQTHKK